MKEIVLAQENLDVAAFSVKDLDVQEDVIQGVILENGHLIKGSNVVITTGTFLNGYIHRGLDGYDGGRDGEQASAGLTASLHRLGLETGRLKTGTPARIHKDSIDYGVMLEQPSDKPIRNFSYVSTQNRLPHISCYITYSNEQTHQAVRDNLDRAPMYNGKLRVLGLAIVLL